jgi:hypothetical protein
LRAGTETKIELLFIWGHAARASDSRAQGTLGTKIESDLQQIDIEVAEVAHRPRLLRDCVNSRRPTIMELMENFVPTTESETSRYLNRYRPAMSGQIMETMPTTAGTIEELKAIVTMANLVARVCNEGVLNSCVLTSYALAAALTDLGYADARPVRVQATCWPDDRQLRGVRLGGPPFRMHLAVCIGQSWLLDPTLDQVNETHGGQWADAGIGVEPVAASIPPEFWDLDLSSDQRLLRVRFAAASTNYALVPQKGLARLPDARPSHWRPLAEDITKLLHWLQSIGEIGAVHSTERDGVGSKTHSAPAEAT